MITFKSLFPLVVGLSFWIYGNILLINKLKNKNLQINESKQAFGLSMDKDLKDKTKSKNNEKRKTFKNKDSFHLNSLITKNISLFTSDPNYKMLTWLLVQIIIFSLFVFTVNIFKNNFIPYFNS